jgi:hypothetical protein
MHLFSPWYVPHAKAVSFFLVVSPK